MKPSELLGTLIPGHPHLLPIINAVREKYQIPEIRPEDDEFTEILLSNDEIDWQAVREDIERKIRANELLLPPITSMLYKAIQSINNNSLDFPELAPLDEVTRKNVLLMYRFMFSIFSPLLPAIDDIYKILADLVFENILTGKTREVPQNWFGKVFVMPSLDGEKTVVAMAGEMSDPKVIAEQFKSEYTRTFGKNKPNLTDMNLITAEYLTMRLQGKSLKYMVEIYAERYPDQFPKNRDSKAYRQAVKTHKATIKKNIQRLQNTIDKM